MSPGLTPSSVRVAVKPICDHLGLAWQTQHRKIMEHHVLSEGITIMVIPSAGGPQKMVTLPLSMLPGWLMTISPGRVAPEIRDTITAYQREAFDVLYRHFFPDNTGAYAVPAAAVDLTATSAREVMVDGITGRGRGEVGGTCSRAAPTRRTASGGPTTTSAGQCCCC